jgi:hypothetical protein
MNTPLGPEVQRNTVGESIPQTAEGLKNLKMNTAKTLEQFAKDRATVLEAREPAFNVTEDQLKEAATQMSKTNPALARNMPEFYMAA